MARIPKIRVNTPVPFPTLVQGSGPVTISKNKGVWTAGLSTSGIPVQVPPPANLGTDLVLVWDSVAQQWITVPLSAFGSGGGGGGSGTVTSLVAGSGITLTPNPITTTGTIAASGGGGSFDPHSPPPIGDVAPNTGAFSTLGVGVSPPIELLEVFSSANNAVLGMQSGGNSIWGLEAKHSANQLLIGPSAGSHSVTPYAVFDGGGSVDFQVTTAVSPTFEISIDPVTAPWAVFSHAGTVPWATLSNTGVANSYQGGLLSIVGAINQSTGPGGLLNIVPTITTGNTSILGVLAIGQGDSTKLTSNDYLNAIDINMVAGNAPGNQNAGVVSFMYTKAGADTFGGDFHGLIDSGATAAPAVVIGLQGSAELNSATYEPINFSASFLATAESTAGKKITTLFGFTTGSVGSGAHFVLTNVAGPSHNPMTDRGIVLTPADDLNPAYEAFAINNAGGATEAAIYKNGSGFFNGDVTWRGVSWTPYTPPTPTASTGAFGSVSASIRYKELGKTIVFNGVLNIPTIGTAAGRAIIALPVNAVAGQSWNINAALGLTTPVLGVVAYDAANSVSLALTGAGSGQSIYFNGTYEAA